VLKAAIAFLATMLATSGVYAGKVGNSFVVDTGFFDYDGCSQDSVTGLQSNRFVVVYLCEYSWDYVVRGKIYDSTANNFDSILGIKIYNSAGADDPTSIASTATGAFVTAWAGQASKTGYDVVAKRFKSTGVRVAHETVANTTRSGDQVQPSVAMLSDGNYVVVWRSHPGMGHPDGIFGRLYDVNAKPLGNEFQINTRPALYADAPSVAALSTGGFVVAWDSGAQLYNAKNKRVAGEFKFNAHVTNKKIMPRVAALENGAFEIVWVLQGHGIYGRRYNRLGRAVGNEIQVAAGTPLSFPAIASLTSGGFVVTWTNTNAGGVFGQIYNVRGKPAGGAFEMDTPDPDLTATYPSHVAGLSSGGFVVTWADISTANNFVYEVRGQLFGP
jgi:hypothetical protein